jgi:DNA (cytosine-5)-methyltransferase 1
MNFYNEIDPFAAAWLRELIKAGHIAPGVVDERSIEDITPDELKQYKQCHFFAGIGVWSYALRCAGWPDNHPVWTGSCPCQPFSTAGKRSGTSDERHLWPAFFHLIRECQPPTVFGEQVASKDGLAWLGTVSADLEGTGYTFGAADLCAAGFGAPHIRQRLYFMAHAANLRCEQQRDTSPSEIQGQCAERSGEHAQPGSEGQLSRGPEGLRGTSLLANTESVRQERSRPTREGRPGLEDSRYVRGFWSGADWIYCRDNTYRPVESGSSPLANGSPARVGRLRGYGNAIVAPVAEAFISSAMEALDI